MLHFIHRSSHACILTSLALLVASSTLAQKPQPITILGAEPVASLHSAQSPDSRTDLSPQTDAQTRPDSTDVPKETEVPPDPPPQTMFQHPDARYWVSGQANIILQGRLPFHSLYEGPNSFRNSAEY
jgi:hypothetical protein